MRRLADSNVMFAIETWCQTPIVQRARYVVAGTQADLSCRLVDVSDLEFLKLIDEQMSCLHKNRATLNAIWLMNAEMRAAYP
jgi:hypothetical protein